MSDDVFEDSNRFLRESPAEPETEPPLISKKDTETLIMSLAQGRVQDGFTEEEIANLLIWAQVTIVNQTLLNLILKGHVFVSTVDNGILLPDGSNMTVILSDLGREVARKLDIEH